MFWAVPSAPGCSSLRQCRVVRKGERRGKKIGKKGKGTNPLVFFSCPLFFSPPTLSERLEQGAHDQTIEPTALQTSDLPIEIARLCFSLGYVIGTRYLPDAFNK